MIDGEFRPPDQYLDRTVHGSFSPDRDVCAEREAEVGEALDDLAVPADERDLSLVLRAEIRYGDDLPIPGWL